MPKQSRFTEEQIIRTLKELEAGAKVDEVSRRIGVTPKTIYRWKAKFGGLEISEAKRLKALDDAKTDWVTDKFHDRKRGLWPSLDGAIGVERKVRAPERSADRDWPQVFAPSSTTKAIG